MKETTLLALIIKLAALFHDVGKATLWFQGKLRGTNDQRDFLRHELLSAIFIEKLVARATSDQEWLSRLASDECQAVLALAYAEMIEEVQHAIREIGKAAKPKEREREFLEKYARSFINDNLPIAKAIHWMVLSHHKMPRGRPNISDGCTYKNFSSRELNLCQDTKQYVAPPRKMESLIKDREWIAAVRDCATRISANLGSSVLPNATVNHGRLALMLSDKWESNSPTRCVTAAVIDRTILAKGLSKNDGSSVALAHHLIDVAGRTLTVHDALLHASGPVVSPYEYPEALTRRSPAGFEYQDTSADLIREKHNPDHGLIVLNVSKTGSGKTIGSCKALAAASPEGLRFMFTQGLRSLVFQTAAALKDDLKFEMGRHIGVRIGSPIITKLAETPQNCTDCLDQDDDPADDLPEDIDPVVTLDEGPRQPLDGILKIGEQLSPNNADYLAVPILVCTLDSLMGVADNAIGRRVHHFLRLMTSDLIIDELDSYSEEDQCAIGRLVRAAGAYGRKVVIASATLPPSTAEAMFRAYAHGYRDYCALKGKPACIDALFVSHVEDTLRFHSYKPQDEQCFARDWAEFGSALVARLNLSTVQRKVAMLDTRGYTKDRDVFDVVVEGCKSLHRNHHITVDGIRVSVGAVRWANTRQTVNFARHLLNKRDWSIRPICYHSKFVSVTRFDIEQRLDVMLNRKGGDDRLITHPDVRRAIDKVREMGGSDLMIVLSTSPVIEVGRDYDLDWGVCDPSGMQQLIQFAGRIGRHRPDLSPDCANILMPDRPHRAIRQSNNDPVFRRPGVETETPNRLRQFLLNETMSERVFDLDVIGDVLDARHRLLEAGSSPIGALEHEKLRYFLFGAADNHCSLMDFLLEYPLSGMTDRYVRLLRFRRETMPDLTIVSEMNDSMMYRYSMTQYGPIRDNQKTYQVQVEDNCEYLLFSLKQPEVRFQELMATVFRNSQMKQNWLRYELMGCSYNSFGDPKVTYNLHLGLDENRP